jgi:hypothetical protein
MPMSATDTLRHIERKLGASFQRLELDQDEIMDTVISETLPTFSNYFPYHHRHIVVPERDQVVDRYGVYYLKTDFDVLGISKISIDGGNVMGAIPRAQINTNPFDMKISSDMLSAIENPLTFNYEAPDKLEIFPKGLITNVILVEMKVVHPSHLRTIPLNMREQFLKLALYDVQDSLHKIRRHFENMNTTFMNIELFLQDLEEASTKREDLLETWRSNFLKSHHNKKLYIY